MGFPHWKNAALVLAGHGSTLNADSSAPTFRHADELRRRGIFAEVHECFWKEEPHFRDVLRQVEADTVYIVPNFISEGYFTERVLPREFGLEGPVSHIGGKTVYYTQPVGCHPSMTGALLQRAETVSAAERPDPRHTCLLLVGHGTSLNQNSVKIVYHQAKVIGEQGPYAECRAAFMEQEPFVKDWQHATSQPNVIVVPFFISDGLHSYEDIPVLLGISGHVRRDPFQNPTEIGGRRIWYASAIGTEPFLAEVILAQIRACDEAFRTSAAVA